MHVTNHYLFIDSMRDLKNEFLALGLIDTKKNNWQLHANSYITQHLDHLFFSYRQPIIQSEFIIMNHHCDNRNYLNTRWKAKLITDFWHLIYWPAASPISCLHVPTQMKRKKGEEERKREIEYKTEPMNANDVFEFRIHFRQ